MAEPLVTVALQVCNAAPTLAVAIRSIVLQTLPDWELVLHDDASTDGSAEVAAGFRDPRIRVVTRASRVGRPACINEAVGLARGRYFALMDADDVAYPDRLERQAAYLDAHPEADLVGAPALVFGAWGRALGKRAVPLSHEDICRRPWSGFPMWQPTFTGRLEWFRRHPYDERRWRGQDQDLLLRSRAVSRFANLPEILAGYREETISLRKSLHTRLHLVASFARAFAGERRPDLALLAVSAQAAKGAVDTFAVASGLGYRVLRQRARPLTEGERERWREVWTLVTGEASPAR